MTEYYHDICMKRYVSPEICFELFSSDRGFQLSDPEVVNPVNPWTSSADHGILEYADRSEQ